MCDFTRTTVEDGRLPDKGCYPIGRGVYEMQRDALLTKRERLREAIMNTTDAERLVKVIKCSLEGAAGYQVAIRAMTRMINLNLMSLLGETVAQIVIEHQDLLAGLDSLSRAKLLDQYPDALNYIVGGSWGSSVLMLS